MNLVKKICNWFSSAPAATADSKKSVNKSQALPSRAPARRPADTTAPFPAKKSAKLSSVENNSKKSSTQKNKNKSAVTPDVSKTPIVKEKPALLREVPTQVGKTRFLDLDLHEDLQFGLQDMGFSFCTTIQEKTLLPLMNHQDLAGKAQTGTGKTAAFLIAAFNHILTHPKPNRKKGCCRVLVMAPTRELAIQIHQDAEKLSVFTNLKNVVVFGGMDHNKQRDALACELDVVIGTPGRIIDYSRSGHLDLSQTEILIIDEADRMLDMGFIPDVRRIIAQLPGKTQRQTILFSATLDESILRLADSWLNNALLIESEPEHVIGSTIEQIFYTASINEKLPLLLHFLQDKSYERIIIFGNRKFTNNDLQRQLNRYGIEAALISGDIPQEKRLKILEAFRSGKERIIIATDVAARGIHVDDVSLVINYDLPDHAEDYVHRIGRTGRAGHSGKSISFVCEYGAYTLPEIEKLLDQPIKCIWPEDEMLQLPAPKFADKPYDSRKKFAKKKK